MIRAIVNIRTRKNNIRVADLYMLLFYAVAVFHVHECRAQGTPFKKSVMDSLSANQFNGSISYAINLGQDGTSSLTTAADIGAMYSTRRSNYSLVANSYFDRYETTSTSNRFFAMATISAFSHDTAAGKVVEKRLYPEPFSLYSFDANRGLNYRWQWGIDAAYAFKPTHIARVKVGAGLLYELENWQMIKKANLWQLDTISDAEKRYLFDTVGINSKGQLYRSNVRFNFYVNAMCTFAKNFNVNVFLNIQQPLAPPYRGLPPNPHFPVVTKCYPRITSDILISYHIWGALNLITNFMLQYDQGQIPLYVPNFVYNLTQGVQFGF
ncbi:MAG TPA: hypothetical protein VMI35_02385 [Puia sp.]|nr:hypothetical protein [Puia sp.]